MEYVDGVSLENVMYKGKPKCVTARGSARTGRAQAPGTRRAAPRALVSQRVPRHVPPPEAESCVVLRDVSGWRACRRRALPAPLRCGPALLFRGPQAHPAARAS
jgi:hypothetical protein